MGGGGRGETFEPGTAAPKAESEDKISYGRKFAQTEELYAAHQMEKELEELAKQDGALDDEKKSASAPAPAKTPVKKADAKPARTTMEDVMRTRPIGAMPAASEPPPRQGLSEVLTDAQRYAGMIRGGLRDIWGASLRLARLPVDVAMLAASRLRPMKA